MAGTVLEIKVTAGQKISAGQEVAVMESMKMEVPVTSASAGVVTGIKKAAGDFVNAGEVIIELQ